MQPWHLFSLTNELGLANLLSYPCFRFDWNRQKMCTLVWTKDNKKLISRWGRRTLRENSYYRLNHVIVVKLYHLYTQFPRDIRLSHWRIVTFSAHHDFLIIAPYKYSHWLTDEFLVKNVYGSFVDTQVRTTWCELNFYRASAYWRAILI